MNCEEATKLMDGYLDGELDPITNQTPRCGPTPERGVFAKTRSKSSNRKAGIAENYRSSRSDPKDIGNKIQPNQ